MRFSPEQVTMIREMVAMGKTAYEIGSALTPNPGNLAKEGIRACGRRAKRFVATLSEEASAPAEPASVVTGGTLSESRTISGDKQVIDLPRTPIRTVEELFAHCEIDPNEWACERLISNKWDMGYKDSSGKASTIPLFQLKAFLVRRKTEDVGLRSSLESIVEQIREHAPAYPRKPPSPSRSGREMLEVSIPDLHVGKLAWLPESGESYGLGQAEALFYQVFERLLRDAQSRDVGQILYVVGNDLLNCDNAQGTTTGGTPQSNDGRYQQAFLLAKRLMVDAVEQLRQVAPVRVISVPGNHDTLSAWTLTEVIKAWFHRAEDVHVDNSPNLRKYAQFGSVLLGFTHGDKERPENLPLIMAQEVASRWASTKWREWHCGHFHKSATKIKIVGDEFNGVRVRTLPSLCATDAWHHSMGYVGQVRSAEAYFWDRDNGLVSVSQVNVA